MKYTDYSVADFANDSFFIQWVKHPDDESEWFWTSFIKEHPQCLPKLEEARKLVSLFDFPSHDLPDAEVASMRNGLLMTLRADREARKDGAPARVRRFATGKEWLRLAAAVLIIPLAAFAAFFLKGEGELKSLVGTGSATVIAKRVNPPGQKSVLFLSDGTKVWLNAASRISYVKDFSGRHTRDVYLEGEAFFDVAHNAKKPFIVHTSSIRIKVLGTSFNVKCYADENTIETTLVRGKVRIEQSDTKGNRIKGVELRPNQQAVFDKESKVININQVVAHKSGAWKQDRLVFDEESIDNVILQLEKWFKVKIHVANKGNLDCRMTATIEKESLEEVLKLMETTNPIHYTVEGDDVFIEGTLCDGGNE